MCKSIGRYLLLPVATLLGLAALGARGSQVHLEAPIHVAVLDMQVIDNSMNGDSDSLRTWMVEVGIEPTGLLREAVARNETYAAIAPRPSFAVVTGSRIEQALGDASEARRCRTTECTIEIGRAVGADRVITGEVTKLSVLIWFVTARVTDVQTGRVLRQDEFEVKGVITDLMPKVMVVLARRMAQVEAPRAAKS
jgi:hypothetical protein